MSSDPIVFIGPGSEWFWSMAQFVVVAITLIGIYYQFRLQRAANAFDQLNRIAAEWESEPMLRARLEVARAVVADEQVPEGPLSVIGNYWEMVASLVKARHIDERAVADTYGGTAAIWWTAVAGTTLLLRELRDDPTIFASFEWLAARFRTDGARAGAAPGYDRAALTRMFDAAIPGIVDRLRMAEASRLPPDRSAARPRRSGGSGQ